MNEAKTETAKESSSEFTEVPLRIKKKKAKLPRRRVYFSDGYLDEYSTDDEDGENEEAQPLIDPKTMAWLPYLWYLTWWVGSKALAVCDYLGEHLAYFLGITSPKFQYEIEQSKRLMEEEEALRKRIAADNAGWNENLSSSRYDPIKMEPLPTKVTLTSDALSSTAKESKDEKTDKCGIPHWERY